MQKKLKDSEHLAIKLAAVRSQVPCVCEPSHVSATSRVEPPSRRCVQRRKLEKDATRKQQQLESEEEKVAEQRRQILAQGVESRKLAQSVERQERQNRELMSALHACTEHGIQALSATGLDAYVAEEETQPCGRTAPQEMVRDACKRLSTGYLAQKKRADEAEKSVHWHDLAKATEVEILQAIIDPSP